MTKSDPTHAADASQPDSAESSPLLGDHARTRLLGYFGKVCLEQNERVFASIERLMSEDPDAAIYLAVSSSGGPSGAAMSFFDMMRVVYRPNLVTIGTGDVDSSGIILFLAGKRRLIARNTTLLLHPAGRYFDGDVRYTPHEIEAILREDRAKDLQYAAIVSGAATTLSPQDVLSMMHAHTILTPADLLSYGLADEIISAEEVPDADA